MFGTLQAQAYLALDASQVLQTQSLVMISSNRCRQCLLSAMNLPMRNTSTS